MLSWLSSRSRGRLEKISKERRILPCRLLLTIHRGGQAVPSVPSVVLGAVRFAHSFSVLILRHGETNANAGGFIQGSSDFSQLTELGKQQAADVSRVVAAAAAAAAVASQNQTISSIYCSPLRRAQETLDILLRQETSSIPTTTEVQTASATTTTTTTTTTIIRSLANNNHNLREIDFYDWEGRHKTELQQEFPVSWKAWKQGDPHNLMVLDTKSSSSTTTTKERYPLLEVWERADQVWKDIWESEQPHQHQHQEQEQQGSHNNDHKMVLIVAHGTLGQALLGTAMGWDATHFREYEFPNCGMVEIEWKNTKRTTTTTDTHTHTHDGSSQDNIRPLATRWRWKWPEKAKQLSPEWNTYYI